VNERGERLSFQLTTGYEALKDILTILKEDALKAGLDLRLEVLDSSAGWKKVSEKKHEIMFTAFGGFLEPYPRYWDFFHAETAWDVPFLEDGSPNPARKPKPQTTNFFSWSDPEMDAWIEQYRTSEDENEMLELSHKMQMKVHEAAIFVPGYVNPFYRVGHWRWLKFPEDFNVEYSQGAGEFHLHWIDEEMRQETLDAQKSGNTFPVEINVYDQYKEE
jgi:microcin C transport system substrate-binding protein